MFTIIEEIVGATWILLYFLAVVALIGGTMIALYDLRRSRPPIAVFGALCFVLAICVTGLTFYFGGHPNLSFMRSLILYVFLFGIPGAFYLGGLVYIKLRIDTRRHRYLFTALGPALLLLFSLSILFKGLFIDNPAGPQA